MRKLYIIHGMKRSGNHALVNWMSGMDRFLFFNNILPEKKVLREGRHLLDPRPFGPWLDQQLKKKRRADLSRFRLKVMVETCRPLLKNVMVGLEDQDVDVCPFNEIPCPVQNIVLIRGARNLFASRIKKAFQRDSPILYPRDNGPQQQLKIALWKRYAAYACGEMPTRPDTQVVHFERWVEDVGYRRAIAARAGLVFSDRGLSSVAREGGGSSFEGSSGEVEGVRSRVLSRSEQLSPEENQVFEEIFMDTELKRLDDRLKALASGPA